MSQAASSKGRENVSKQKSYATLNLNQTFVGSKAESKTSSGVQRHGLQTLGKIGLSRRPPPPANLPSLKKENLGNDPSVNLVPTGKSGWGKKEKEAKQQQQQQQQQLQTEQQPSPSIQPPAKTAPPEEVSLRPNAGAVPKQSESKKSWSNAKLPPSTSTATGTTPPSSTYFQREFPTLGGNGGQGRLQKEDGVEGENGRNASDVGARHPFPPEDHSYPQDGREPRQMFNGNTPVPQHMRQQPPFYQQPFGDQFGPNPAMYPVNRGMPGFPPMPPGAYPFPIPGNRKDQMHMFDQRFMRMPMHAGQPPFPQPEEMNATSDKPPSAKKSNVSQPNHKDGSSSGHFDWANAQDEVDYNAKLKFDESDGDDSPRSSPKPKSSSKDKSNKKDKSSNQSKQLQTSNDKEPQTSKASTDSNQQQQQRENWADMYPGYQSGPVPMAYPPKWGMGYVQAYDPRHPMPVPHPYTQYPPNWFFMQQAQMRMNHPMSTNDSSETREPQAAANVDKPDNQQDQNAESTGPNILQQKDQPVHFKKLSEEEEKQADKSDGGSAPRNRSASENDPSRRTPPSTQYRLQEQSFSKSSGELPPRFRQKNQQKQSPSAEYPNKSMANDAAGAKLSDKSHSSQGDESSVRKIIKRKDSTRSDDGLSVASHDSSERLVAPSKEGRSPLQADDRSGYKVRTYHKSDHKEAGSNRSTGDSKKGGNRPDRGSSQGKASSTKPNNTEKQEKSKTSKGKVLKEGMKKLEKSKSSKSNPSTKPQTQASSTRTHDNDTTKAATPAKEQDSNRDQRKTAWSTVVTGEPSSDSQSANATGAAVNVTKKSLLDIQKEQEQKDKEEHNKGKDTAKHNNDLRVEDLDQVSDKYDKQQYRGRDKLENKNSKPYNERRYPEDRKRKYDSDTQREARNYNNRRDDRPNDRTYSNRQPPRNSGGYNNVDKQDSRYNSSRNRKTNYDEKIRDDTRRSYKSKDEDEKATVVDAESKGIEATVPATLNKSTENKTKNATVEQEDCNNKENLSEKSTEVFKAKATENKDDKGGIAEQLKSEQPTQSKKDSQSIRRKESEKYSTKYQSRYDDKRKIRANDRQQVPRSHERRRDHDDKHPDRPLYSSRGRGRGRGTSRDTRPKNYNNGKYSATRDEDNEKPKEETASPETAETEKKNTSSATSVKPKHTDWGQYSDADQSDDSGSDCKEAHGKPISSRNKYPSNRGRGSRLNNRSKGYESKHHEEATAPRFQRNDGPGRGRGRFPRGRGVNKDNGRLHNTTGRGRSSSKGGSKNFNGVSNESGGPQTSRANNDESSDTSLDYHSAGEAMSSGSTCGDEVKSPTRRHDQDKSTHSSRGARRPSGGKGKPGHFLAHRQQVGGRSNEPSVSGDAPPAASSLPSDGNQTEDIKSKKENVQLDEAPSADRNGDSAENKKGFKNAKPPPAKVDLFSTFDVRDIAGVVCIDDHPINDVLPLLLKEDGGDDDDGFVEVTYKRGGQKETRDKIKKDIRKKSKDDLAKPAKIPKQDIKSAPKNTKSSKTNQDPASRISPVMQGSLPSASVNQTIPNSNAAMAAVGEWEPARSLMRSNGNPNNSGDQSQLPSNPLTPPPGNAWQRPLSFASSQHAPDPKAVGSGKPKPQIAAPSSSGNKQQTVDSHAAGFDASENLDLQPKEAADVIIEKSQSQSVSQQRPAHRLNAKDKTERPKREAKASTKTPMQKRDTKKTTERRVQSEKAPRFQKDSKSKTLRKDAGHSKHEKNKTNTEPTNVEAPCKEEVGKQPAIVHEASVKISRSKMVDSAFADVPLEIQPTTSNPLVNSLPSPSKVSSRSYSDEDTQNAKDTARSVINSLGDDDDRNLETKSLPGTPPLAVEIPEPTLSGPSSDPGRKGSPGPRSMAHEFTELSLKLLSTKVKEVWDNPINGPQVSSHSWSEATHSTEDVVYSATTSQAIAKQDVLSQSDINKSSPRKDNKRDDALPLQRTQDVFSSKRMTSDAQNVCKVKPRQQQTENESKATDASYSSQQLLSTQRPSNHQNMMNFQVARDQKAPTVPSQFANASEHRMTQVVQPTVLQSDRDYNEAYLHHHQSMNLQQIPNSQSHLHSSSSSALPSQDAMQQRLVLNNVYGQPGMSLPQNQMMTPPWQVVSNQTQGSGNTPYRSHPNGTMFSASPVSLPNSAVYMAFDPQAASNTQVQQQGGSSQVQHQPVGIMLPRQGPHHQTAHHPGSYINVQGQQYQIRPPMMGNLGDIPHSDSSALINHVNAKPFKPQTGVMPNGAPQHVMHNQLVASVRPRPMTSSRSMSSGISPPVQMHDQTRLSSPPIDPNIQFVAAGMPIKGHHMLPHNPQLSQHLSQIPPQMFRQQQGGNTFVQRGPPGAINPRFQRPMPGPIQRPGSGTIHLSSQIVGAPRPRQPLPFQASPSAQNPIFSKTQSMPETMNNLTGFRDQQHQKMIADTQKFFQNAEPVVRRNVLPERSPNSDLENQKITSPQTIIPPNSLSSPPISLPDTQKKAEEESKPHQESIRSTKEPPSPVKLNSENDLPSPIPKEAKVIVPLNAPIVDQ